MPVLAGGQAGVPEGGENTVQVAAEVQEKAEWPVEARVEVQEGIANAQVEAQEGTESTVEAGAQNREGLGADLQDDTGNRGTAEAQSLEEETAWAPTVERTTVALQQGTRAPKGGDLIHDHQTENANRPLPRRELENEPLIGGFVQFWLIKILKHFI